MSQTKSRIKVINLLYVYELTKTNFKDLIAENKQNLLTLELETIKWISKKYPQLKQLILKFIKPDWTWKRMAALEKALLIYGSFELIFRDKRIVINEIVEIAKKYIFEDSYKFINAILDKIAKYYEKTNQTTQTPINKK